MRSPSCAAAEADTDRWRAECTRAAAADDSFTETDFVWPALIENVAWPTVTVFVLALCVLPVDFDLVATGNLAFSVSVPAHDPVVAFGHFSPTLTCLVELRVSFVLVNDTPASLAFAVDLST